MTDQNQSDGAAQSSCGCCCCCCGALTEEQTVELLRGMADLLEDVVVEED